MGTIGLLLLVACANVATLQLVRTEARGQELAIRAALGAGWGVIARSLLVESSLLGLVGGCAGLALAAASLPVLLAIAALMPMTSPRMFTSGPPELPGLIAASVWIMSVMP